MELLFMETTITTASYGIVDHGDNNNYCLLWNSLIMKTTITITSYGIH